MNTASSLIANPRQSPRAAYQLQLLTPGNSTQSSPAGVTQPPRKTTPPARAKKNPGHGTMRMVKSKMRPGMASEKESNAGTASPILQPITVPAEGDHKQNQKDTSTIVPVQSIEDSMSTLPPDQQGPQLAMLNSRQFRRLQAPHIDRPIDSTERVKRTGRQVSTSSTPDLRRSENTPDIIGLGQVANTMQAHIEEYKSGHVTLVKVSGAVTKSQYVAK